MRSHIREQSQGKLCGCAEVILEIILEITKICAEAAGK
jgi:hypothetical protein